MRWSGEASFFVLRTKSKNYNVDSELRELSQLVRTSVLPMALMGQFWQWHVLGFFLAINGPEVMTWAEPSL